MSDQISDRRAKVNKIAALGFDPFGGRFTGVTPNNKIRATGESLNIAAGQICDEPSARFRAAGRVVLFRDIGSLLFLTVRDRTGDLQFGLSRKMIAGPAAALSHSAGDVARANDQAGSAEPALPNADATWKLAKLLDLGDFVGADGRLGRTKTGELTLWADKFALLSKAIRPPPEKWHGLTDVEQRYRHRYVDLFANPDSRRVFVQRARIIEYFRRVLHERGFVEVDTPVLQPIYGGAAARPFITFHNALDLELYLRISPELYLKRCLVGGLERVYEFARCFRNEGISPRHNPEFTMLELYQAYADYHDMMDLCEATIGGAAREVIGATKIRFGHNEIDYTTPWPRRRYADLLREHAGVAIDDRAAVLARARAIGLLAKLQRAQAAVSAGVDPAKVAAPGMEQQPVPDPTRPAPPAPSASPAPSGDARPSTASGDDQAPSAALHVDHALLVNALFEELVEHHLTNPTFVIDYPAALCPLTRRDPQNPDFALRFELYINGMELGNAYSELNDPQIQRENLAAQVEGEGDETMRVMDEDFVEALEYGMPPAGGLGIGIDRAVMLLTGSPSIRDVLLFPLQRPQA
ncbi:MAG: lysine--tRNA ligase [Planctomycetota bacterium]